MKKEITQLLTILMGLICPISILFAQTPDWSVNAADYSLDASIVSSVVIDGEISTDTNDKIAVFDIHGVIRGVANVTFEPALNKYITSISILSNSNGDLLTFKIYDSSEDKIVSSTNDALVFSPNQVLGDADNPYVIEATIETLGFDKDEINLTSFYLDSDKSLLHIQTSDSLKSIILYTMFGKEIINLSVNKQNEFALSLSEYPNGVYLVMIIDQQNRTMLKKIAKY